MSVTCGLRRREIVSLLKLCLMLGVIALAVFLIVFFVFWYPNLRARKESNRIPCLISALDQNKSFCCTKSCTRCEPSSTLSSCSALLTNFQNADPDTCPTNSSPTIVGNCPAVFPTTMPCTDGMGSSIKCPLQQRICTLQCPVCANLVWTVNYIYDGQSYASTISLDVGSDRSSQSYWAETYPQGSMQLCFIDGANPNVVRFEIETSSWVKYTSYISGGILGACVVAFFWCSFCLCCGCCVRPDSSPMEVEVEVVTVPQEASVSQERAVESSVQPSAV